MPYETSRLTGYGVYPATGPTPFAVVGLWSYRGRASKPIVAGWYDTWEKAYEIKTILEDAIPPQLQQRHQPASKPLREQSVFPYLIIRNHYRERILKGDLLPGTKIPSLKKVAEEFGVAAETAVRALRKLKAEGLLYTTSQGTWVADRKTITNTEQDEP